MMEQVRLCAVWSTENWLGTSLNQAQGWTAVREYYSCALEQGPLLQMQSRENCRTIKGERERERRKEGDECETQIAPPFLYFLLYITITHAHVQGDPSGRRLHFVDFDLVVPMSTLFFLLGQLQI